MSGWANHIEPIKGTRPWECGMRVRQCQSQGDIPGRHPKSIKSGMDDK